MSEKPISPNDDRKRVANEAHAKAKPSTLEKKTLVEKVKGWLK